MKGECTFFLHNLKTLILCKCLLLMTLVSDSFKLSYNRSVNFSKKNLVDFKLKLLLLKATITFKAETCNIDRRHARLIISVRKIKFCILVNNIEKTPIAIHL